MKTLNEYFNDKDTESIAWELLESLSDDLSKELLSSGRGKQIAINGVVYFALSLNPKLLKLTLKKFGDRECIICEPGEQQYLNLAE